jgi:hypothetical protein
MAIAAASNVFQEEAATTVSTKNSDGESSAVNDRNGEVLESETATKNPIEEIHSVEIGPIFSAKKLEQAIDILRENGLEHELVSDMATVSVIRLFEGSYTHDTAQQRLKEIQEVVKTAFILPEKGKRSIYVATYQDQDKAIEKSKQLSEKNIKVTPVSTEIKIKCTNLVVKQFEQSKMTKLQDQMLKIGLSVNKLKSI